MLEISDVCFPFDSSNDMTYCYPLKLSILCKPGAKEEHEHILSQIDLGVMQPYLLEVACFIGIAIGTDNKYFKAIAARRPWLFGQTSPSLFLIEQTEK